ncbi:acyl-CoA dehydrogenase family protein [Hamadaea tsunoensis]|uniref:acyl-CoA dehydrogenase family protein n=1 Tax=Hamadaea tsunoensis TaxID=53368 RepID=UPI0003FCC9D8|nr:acyl-CoA dehydrogenase family protein [Hamadaea tsunoensis]
MRDAVLTEDQLAFRDTVRAFVRREVLPHYPAWEEAGRVDRSAWLAAGRQGLLGLDMPAEYGGGDCADYRFAALITEELARTGTAGFALALHNDIIGPYLLGLADQQQRGRWLPGFCSGGTLAALALTEPGAGSDLAGVRTSARRDGDDYVLTGSKTLISNALQADIVLVAAVTDPARQTRGRLTLLVVERDMPGFTRGPALRKIGLHAQDTAELFFDEVRVPAANRLGDEGGGWQYLMRHLPRERLSIAVAAVAAAEAVLAETIAYCRDRRVFGRTLGEFQHVRFELAEMSTEVEIARTYADQCVLDHVAGRLDEVGAARAKWWTTDLQRRVVDRCLQLHGGYGYLVEYPVARAYMDTRMMPIYGGTNEIMKEIIGRSLGL